MRIATIVLAVIACLPLCGCLKDESAVKASSTTTAAAVYAKEERPPHNYGLKILRSWRVDVLLPNGYRTWIVETPNAREPRSQWKDLHFLWEGPDGAHGTQNFWDQISMRPSKKAGGVGGFAPKSFELIDASRRRGEQLTGMVYMTEKSGKEWMIMLRLHLDEQFSPSKISFWYGPVPNGWDKYGTK